MLTELSYIFQELVTGGDLYFYHLYHSKLNKQSENDVGCLPEAHAAAIALQIVQGVSYLHSEGIAHRDLKLDNLLMASLDRDARVVLTDFGSAIKYMHVDKERRLKKHRPIRLITHNIGTTEYSAPYVSPEHVD